MTYPTLSELNTRLTELRLRQHERALLERRVLSLQEQLAAERSQLKYHSATLAHEQRDVTRLEGLSLSALFASVLGTKDERLDRERQELLAAQLKHDTSQAVVTGLEHDLAGLHEQLDALGDLDVAHEATLRDKELALLTVASPAAGQLAALNDEVVGLHAMLRETDEAVAAGQQAIASLHNLLKALESAEGWGTFDMFGGGLLATMAKHNRIDDARAVAHQVQQHLRRFRAELGDVQLEGTPGGISDIDGLTTFGDYFFDGLLMDWIVQCKIEHSLAQTRQVAETVQTLVTTLETRQATTELQLRAVEERRRALIEGA